MVPTKFTGKVKNIKMLNFRDIEVEFEHVNPKQMEFIAGQFISLKVGETSFRTYSIASSINNLSSIVIVVSVHHQGIGSNYLNQLKVGDSVSYFGPSGIFKLTTPLEDNLYFFATGTGLAPFIPMFHKLLNEKFSGSINLYFGIRSEDELFYTEKLDYFKNNLKNFKYNILYSQPISKDNIPKYISTSSITNFGKSHFYLCGHPQMIADITKDLKENRGVPDENIIFEKYTISNKPS